MVSSISREASAKPRSSSGFGNRRSKKDFFGVTPGGQNTCLCRHLNAQALSVALYRHKVSTHHAVEEGAAIAVNLVREVHISICSSARYSVTPILCHQDASTGERCAPVAGQHAIAVAAARKPRTRLAHGWLHVLHFYPLHHPLPLRILLPAL